MAYRVFVITSNEYLWALRPFSYLFNIYWSELQEVVIAGFHRPRFVMPSNFRFFQIERYNYPKHQWSNALIKLLDNFQNDEHFVLMLEDYWLVRTVDLRGVAACFDYVRDHPGVLRMDLTSDRLYAGGMYDVDYWGCYDIIETPHGTPYQISLQAAIWKRSLLLKVLKENVSPWDFEVHTQPPENMRVLGTRQNLVRYSNAILKGKLDNEQLKKMPKDKMETIKQWIPKKVYH